MSRTAARPARFAPIVLLGGRTVRIGPVEPQAGEVGDPVHVGEAQGGPPLPPGAARPGTGVQQHVPGLGGNPARRRK
jgi:hypothetical protein